ncbi:MAG: MarR family transcriptional regulator [Clostridiales bacterium]|nr:MarR family transcriptional regulator [Clostridiales bacterium]
MDIENLEELVFSYVDKVKKLTSPQTWGNILLDLSKNDLFTMLFLYRKGQVTMTEIAEYMKIPLNTATGVISRLEKKNLITRERSTEDKRIVTVRISEGGMVCMKDIFGEFLRFGEIVMRAISPEELQVILSSVNKLFEAIEENERQKSAPRAESRIRKIVIE